MPATAEIADCALTDEVDALAARLGAVVGTLDPDGLTPATALRLLGALARVGRHAAAGEALVARRVESCKAHATAGYRSTEQMLASMAGTSAAQASKIVETGRRLAAHDQTAGALREGRVSVEQAHAVTTAAQATPDAEGDLLAFAARESLRRLESRAREVRLAADDDRLGRYRRQHAARSVVTGIGDDGMGWGRWQLPPDLHAAVVNRLERRADLEYRNAYRERRRESHDRYLADALVTLCGRDAQDGERATTGDATASGVRADVVMHVSYDAYRRREVAPGEVCMIQDAGPVPVEMADTLLADGAFLKGVLVDGTDVMTVKHFGRHRPAVLQTALDVHAVLAEGTVTCAAEGCDQHLGLEWDHAHPHADGGPTSYQNLQPLCHAHHRHKSVSDRQQATARSGPDPP